MLQNIVMAFLIFYVFQHLDFSGFLDPGWHWALVFGIGAFFINCSND